ncbi:hypothetical protein FSS13T_12070 [Flavobacterium saliperosum S13]|uniref:Uncharacterized protein n=1 Tax=Flavobacterium saliperosum S13 TaxID=1341155 RepID=A0ABN0QH48_9FLAO|nr:hypothetical protein FSS13T_12070 [Flavobacterium saliperosum S13]
MSEHGNFVRVIKNGHGYKFAHKIAFPKDTKVIFSINNAL